MKAKRKSDGAIVDVYECMNLNGIVYYADCKNARYSYRQTDLDFTLSEPEEEVTIEGYIVRDKYKSDSHNTDLYIGVEKPIKDEDTKEWYHLGYFIPLNPELFPSVTWESDPLPVTITIKPKKK